MQDARRLRYILEVLAPWVSKSVIFGFREVLAEDLLDLIQVLLEHVLDLIQFGVGNLQFLAKERDAHQLSLGQVGLLGMLKLNQGIATIFIQDFDFLYIAVVAKQVKQVSYLLLVVFGLRQVLNH